MKLLFVYSSGWPQRLRAVSTGDAPAEGYGYFALRDWGVDVEGVDSSLPCSAWRRTASQILQRWFVIPRSALGYRLDQAWSVRAHLRGDQDRSVVATSDSIALPLLALKRRERLPNEIAYISIGLCQRLREGAIRPELVRRYIGLIRQASAVLVFTPMEAELLRSWLPDQRVHVIPLGIDSDWWAPPKAVRAEPATILSVGRDSGRDFPTLATALSGLPVRTAIVGPPARMQDIRETPTLAIRDEMTISELREELWRTELIVVPTRKALYGSGQTTALQAMAAGRPVIMTDHGWAAASGLRHTEHFMDVAAEDPRALREAVAGVLQSPDRGAAMGRRAQAAVARIFSTESQARAILDAFRAA